MKKIAFILINVCFSSFLIAQINITTGGTALALAQLIAGAGVTVSNATISCDGTGYGIFTSGNVGAGNIGLNGGVLLTTGDAGDAAGSEAGILTVDNSTPPPDPDLLIIQSNATFNNCKLEFDIIPLCPTLNMSYVFASEEYPDYVCATVNDACGLFISGPGITGTQNIATIPGTSTGVAINSINSGIAGSNGTSGGCTSLAYSSLFVDNTGGSQIEYGGFTVPLTASITVTPCQTYHLKMVIADAGDPIFDSGLFIQQNSISCSATTPSITNASICSGQSTTLTVTGSSNGTYTWTPATNLSTTSGSVVVANPLVTTIYTVTSPGGCTSILTQTTTVTVNSTGTPSISPAGPFCDTNPTITLTVSSIGGTWSGIGITNASTGVFNPATAGAGTHIITYSVSNSCGAGTASVSVVVTTGASSPSISAVGPFCVSNSNVPLSSNVLGGVWLGVGITNSLTGVFSPSLAGSGTSTITYSVSGTCSSGSATTIIVVTPLPIANFNVTSVCQSSATAFTDASNTNSGIITNWEWDFTNDGSTDATTQNPTFTYPSAGTYTTSLFVTTSGSCSIGYTAIVNVYPNPLVNIITQNVCLGSVSSFSSFAQPTSAAIANWQWDVNNSIVSFEATGEQSSFSFLSAGIYTLQLVAISNQGCVSLTSNTIAVYDNPVTLFTVDKAEDCPLHCVTFTDNSTINSPSQINNWSWNFGNGTSSNNTTNASPQVCYENESSNQLALYTITLTTTSNNGCITSLVKTNYITVYPKPIANYTIVPDLGNVVAPQVYFQNQSVDYTKWYWTFGDGPKIDSTNVNPSHTYTTSEVNQYNSMLIVANQYGCKDTAQLLVDIAPEFVFYIPNTFSPNGDGINDGFIGVGIGIVKYEMWIYERWGNMVYYTDDITKPWHGKVQGKEEEAPQNVYTWKVELKDIFGKKHNYVGHVTLLR